MGWKFGYLGCLDPVVVSRKQPFCYSPPRGLHLPRFSVRKGTSLHRLSSGADGGVWQPPGTKAKCRRKPRRVVVPQGLLLLPPWSCLLSQRCFDGPSAMPAEACGSASRRALQSIAMTSLPGARKAVETAPAGGEGTPRRLFMAAGWQRAGKRGTRDGSGCSTRATSVDISSYCVVNSFCSKAKNGKSRRCPARSESWAAAGSPTAAAAPNGPRSRRLNPAFRGGQ